MNKKKIDVVFIMSSSIISIQYNLILIIKSNPNG